MRSRRAARLADPDMNYVGRPAGTYERWPLVTWDLAAERWVQLRCDQLIAICQACRWQDVQSVLIKPERQDVAEFIVGCQHWYSCTAAQPQVRFIWMRTGRPAYRGDGSL